MNTGSSSDAISVLSQKTENIEANNIRESPRLAEKKSYNMSWKAIEDIHNNNKHKMSKEGEHDGEEIIFEAAQKKNKIENFIGTDNPSNSTNSIKYDCKVNLKISSVKIKSEPEHTKFIAVKAVENKRKRKKKYSFSY